MVEVWFWQVIISPHIADLAVALAQRGIRVRYVAQRELTDDRIAQGWLVPHMPEVDLVFVTSRSAVVELVDAAPRDSIHICQGVRGNGLVVIAQRALSARHRQQWVLMETVNDVGVLGPLKRLVYRHLLSPRRLKLQGVLATGYRTRDWVIARGVKADRVYPFAYFLREGHVPVAALEPEGAPFRFIFVGRLIRLKRVDLLIEALSRVQGASLELWIVGTGPEEINLRHVADGVLRDRVRWFGRLPQSQVPPVIALADCLVLPSSHDGWGAVGSEALMVGTPVVCSDACGISDVVRESRVGGVFEVDDSDGLVAALQRQLERGRVSASKRRLICEWARCLGAQEGALYLNAILLHQIGATMARPSVPWRRGGDRCL